MKEVITSKGKTVLVPDNCEGPRNRHLTGKQRREQAKSPPLVAPKQYGPRIQAHRIRREETPA